MNEQTKDEVRTTVREQYGSIARSTTGASCCAPGSCGPGANASLALGYSAEDLAAVREGANMGLGCGNPQAIAALKAGETVLDLGAGGGFDGFLAAKQVGPSGRVIGVDMTPDMVSKARANAQKLEAKNVDFRLGEIEHLPLADGTVDERPELTWAPSYALVTTMAMRPDQPLESARFVREEVVDVLAEAMWALLCAGRWPGVRRHGGGPAAGSPVAREAAQARPRAPCGATAATTR